MTLIDGLLGRDPSSSSVTQFEVIVYGAVSFLIVSILGLLIYITCSKRYRLNWFENNLLETDREREARKHDPSHVTCPIPYNVDAVAGSSRYLNRNNGSPLAKADDPPFWASQGIYKKPSNTGQLIDSSDEEAPDDSADSSSSCMSVIAVGSVPIARTDKHVVLSTTSPARPTTATVKAKNNQSKGSAGGGGHEIVDGAADLLHSPVKIDSDDESRGAIHLTLTHDPSAGILNVKLVEAQDLQPRDFSGTADPYAKIRLLPDRNNMWQTRIHKKTLNPAAATMARYVGLDKLGKLMKYVSDNGGIRASLYKLYRMDEMKAGRMVGQDKYGNKYFEDPSQFYGRNRWVEYAPHFNLEYDGSQIPADWFGWMHYKTDLPPNRDGSRAQYPWMMDHSENLSGTKNQYMPYSTTRPKVEAWDPKKASKSE